MICDLPFTVEIDGIEYEITNQCDYRMVLDVICVLNDIDLTENDKINTALFIFYKDIEPCENLKKAVQEMYKIISYGEEQEASDEGNNNSNPPLMSWEHDFPIIAPPISKILGYEIRNPKVFTHWYTFIGAYLDIGECTFSTVVSIRRKLFKGIKLEKHEQEFYDNNRKLVDLPFKFSQDDEEWLNAV